MKKQILFVTKGGEDCDAGFSYVLELARTLNTGVAVLIVYPKQMMSTFEDVMAAAAFAEAGDFGTVKTLINRQEQELLETEKQKLDDMEKRCRQHAIALGHSTAKGDAADAIRIYLKESPATDMVLLSPSLSEGKKFLDIRKLIKNISKPIVNISRPASAGA